MKTFTQKFSKTFTKCLALTVLAIGGVTATADAQWRKTWDFTKGLSEETIANLTADNTNWYADGTNTWASKIKLSGYLTANNEVISELNGLEFTTTGQSNSNNIRISTNKLRLTRNNMQFKLPPMIGGQTLTIVAQSANGSATDRGFKFDSNMEWVDGPTDGICKGPDGVQTLVWKVKESVTDSTVMTISMVTGGVDISLIMIDKGDAPAIEGPKQIAYITGETDFDDVASFFDGASDQFAVTAIPSTAEDVALDSLQTFDAVVISPYVGVNDAMASVLRKAVAYTPVLNLNAELVKGWGLISDIKTAAGTLTIPEGVDASELLGEIDVTEGLALFTADVTKAVVLDKYFADDDIIAVAGEDAAIHQHNATRNSYIYVPFAFEYNPEIYPSIVLNATNVVAATKSKVGTTAAPTIAIEYKDKVSTVTITNSNPRAVMYYTLDDTDPTVESAKYEDPIVLKEKKIIKAIATMDGFLDSKMVTDTVVIKNQAAMPVIDRKNDADSTTVTLSCATEGVDIYYNYHKDNDKATSQKYTGPIVLKEEPATIYAFAVGGEYVQSETAVAYVSINSINANTIRMDTVSHFSAGEEAWYREGAEGSSGAVTAFKFWGSAWEYYDTNNKIGEEVGVDADGNPVKIPVYAANPESYKTYEANEGTENDWFLYSSGECLTGELRQNNTAGVGNGAENRYYETAEDVIGGTASKGTITFTGASSGNPFSAGIQSTKPFTAPFDVVVYCGNGNGSPASKMEVQISKDGKEWTSIGELKMAGTIRYLKKTRIQQNELGDYYVRVAHTGGGIKAQVYDIYIMNNGEVSKTYDPSSSIEEIIAGNEAAEVVAVEVYNLNGYRLAKAEQGVNIIRTVYADGTVKVEKVIVK